DLSLQKLSGTVLDYNATDTCPGGTNPVQTSIDFQCGKTMGTPEFVALSECVHYFEWKTYAACKKDKFKPHKEVPCYVFDSDGKKHDLNPLIQVEDGYLVDDGNDDDLDFYINICRSLFQGSVPKMVAESNCRYEVEWVTEYACHRDYLESHTCKLTSEQHDISIDLSPLTHSYSDGDLSLIYPGGDKCSSGFQRMTIINFQCNKTANNGHGSPVFAGETDCTYYFNWDTAFACVKEKEDLLCQVRDGRKHYDLSRLTRYPKNNKTINLGSFLSPPRITKQGSDIRLMYTEGAPCGNRKTTQTILTLKCKPGFSFDLSPLTKPNGGYYNMTSGGYDYYINVCGPVKAAACPEKAGACQVEQWSLGEANSLLSYYDGLIQLTYSKGSQYNNANHTLRSTLISFLCDPEAGAGSPEFQVEDNFTYNFRWYTSYACPQRPHECLVTDPITLDQYDLSLSRSTSANNWVAMDMTDVSSQRKYYINVCRPIVPVPGCDQDASVCQMKYITEKEVVSVSNMGKSKRGPIIEARDRLLLEFTDGSVCMSEGQKLSYTTLIHLVCHRRAIVKSPQFELNQNCTAIFIWETKAACAIQTVENNTCSIVDPDSNFKYNLQLLASKDGYRTTANGKDFLTRDTFIVNFVCDPNAHPGSIMHVHEEMSSLSSHVVHNVLFEFSTALACVPAAVDCTIAVGPLGACGVISGKGLNLGYMQSSPQVAEDGSISIVYQNGDKCGSSSTYSTRIILQCDDSPGSPVLDSLDGCEYIFRWRTSEACPIRKVQDNCRVRDSKSGYEFDFSSLKDRDFAVTGDKYIYHLSVCSPLQKNVCSAKDGVSSCQVAGKTQKVALSNQKLSFVGDQILLNYTSGDVCHKIYNRSTVISFSCNPDKHPQGVPEFMKETPDCTYLFSWPTALACIPVKTTSCSYSDGQGHSYDLSPLALDSQNWEVDVSTQDPRKIFYINVCRSLVQQGSWKCPSSAASCLKDGGDYVSLGQLTSGPQLDRGILKLQYTGGHRCSDGSNNRSSIIRLQCDKDKVDSRPILISVIEDCVYTFLWSTAAACPLNTSQHIDCRVTNPATHLFDLNPLKKSEDYVVYDHNQPQRMFRLNICGEVTNSGCSPGTVCIKGGNTAISGGEASTRLSYRDHVLELTYEGGSPCSANPNLKHKTIINFICRVFFSIPVPSDDEVDQNDNSPDFYLNLCEPLNPIPDVACPPGAAVCLDPDNGPPDIGRSTSGPQMNNITGEVFITYQSSTRCAADPHQNYSSTIVFTCQKGVELQGSPQMLRLQGCVYLFEWATPIVCPDATQTSGCQLKDSQLDFTFDLKSLSGEVQSGTYHINVCGSVAEKSCKQSAVCLVPGSGSTMPASSFGISKAMTMDFKHENQAVLMHYGGGDPCTTNNETCVFPFTYMNKLYSECTKDGSMDGKKWCATTSNYDKDRKFGQCSERQSSILFTCEHFAGHGTPELLSETNGCLATFEWKTSAVCPPTKMECKLVSQHHTFDLRSMSSRTKPWKFTSQGYYYFNLCQGIHGGLTSCPTGATVCRHSKSGQTETLGWAYTQKMGYTGKISVNYSGGDDVCGKGLKAKTVIQLSCGSTVGHCEFVIGWETRLACAVKQQEVHIENGMIKVPDTGTSLNLGELYSAHQASGDIRTNGDRYIYHIQLSGITNNSLPKCLGANICQVKLNADYRRKIGSSDKAKYYIKGNLDVLVPSDSKCHGEENRTVYSTITFYCNPSVGVGIPEFLRETDDCQYLFVWHTEAVCGLTVDRQTSDGDIDSSHRSQTSGIMLTVLLVVLVVCLLGYLLHKRERELVMQKVAGCCKRGNQVSYKYSKVNTDEEGGEEEMEWLMEELETPLSSSSHRGRSNHSNGHIRTKPVNTDGLRSFSLDEQDDDSEDEVLSVPGV
uniref:Insulin-like growth factor 2 receptor n=1 Tax=Poecilia latipinna TaxID=48699 RepID=A0A3B3VE79_9TELE